MENYMVTDDDLKLLRHTKLQAEAVRESAKYMCERLKKLFDESFEDRGLIFNPQSHGPVVCLIETPVGQGRMVLHFAIGQHGVIGSAVVERQRFDRDDRVIWEPVYSIVVPPGEDNPFVIVGERNCGIYIYTAESDEQCWLSLRNVGFSILRAILTGPVLP